MFLTTILIAAGFIIGTWFGVAIMALMNMAKNADK